MAGVVGTEALGHLLHTLDELLSPSTVGQSGAELPLWGLWALDFLFGFPLFGCLELCWNLSPSLLLVGVVCGFCSPLWFEFFVWEFRSPLVDWSCLLGGFVSPLVGWSCLFGRFCLPFNWLEMFVWRFCPPLWLIGVVSLRGLSPFGWSCFFGVLSPLGLLVFPVSFLFGFFEHFLYLFILSLCVQLCLFVYSPLPSPSVVRKKRGEARAQALCESLALVRGWTCCRWK